LVALPHLAGCHHKPGTKKEYKKVGVSHHGHPGDKNSHQCESKWAGTYRIRICAESTAQEGNILILLSCSGYLYLLYWWVLFIKKGNKGETSFTMSKKQIVILVSLLATALSSWFFLSLTTYRPRRGDVVQDQYTLKNTDKLDAFMADAAKGKEEKIRVVVRIFKKSSDHPDGPKGAIIYDLQSRHDAKAKESWIEVRPDLRYFNQSKATQFLIINNPQQCGSVIKDEEKGYYLLTQCHDAWSYELFPLKGTAGSDMERMGP
jgi:hypothetical protein